VHQLVPLSDAGPSESNDANENPGDRRKKKPQKQSCIQPENASADADVNPTTEVDVNTQLLDKEANTYNRIFIRKFLRKLIWSHRKMTNFFKSL
jgi:hypothetical protein